MIRDLATYTAAPRLAMADWRVVIHCLLRAEQDEVFGRLVEAMAQDEASAGVPADAFGLLMRPEA